MTRKAKTNLIAIGFILVLLAIGGINKRNAPPVPKVAEAPAKVVAPEERCKGYKGEARNFSGLVQQSLRNPDSFEHVETAYGPIDDGARVATMTYRATNGFGAIDTYQAIGEVRVSDCAAKVLKAG